eukprot:3302784-Prymnesium_polylepis.3
MNERLNNLAEPGCFIHAVEKHDQCSHVIRLKQHLALFLLVRVLVVYVPSQHALRILEEG